MLLKTDSHLLLESFPSNLSIPQIPTLLQPLPSDFTSFEHIPCDPTTQEAAPLGFCLPGNGGGGGGKGGAGGGGRGRASSAGGARVRRSRSEWGMPSFSSAEPTRARASLPMDSRPRALGSKWHRRWKASSFSLMSRRRVCTWWLVFS